MKHRGSTVGFVLVAVLVTATAPAWASSDKLGTVKFPTSCSAAAQPEFERGVASLHSFWFDAAIKAFTAATQTDSGCAMGHWGAAVPSLTPRLATLPEGARRGRSRDREGQDRGGEDRARAGLHRRPRHLLQGRRQGGSSHARRRLPAGDGPGRSEVPEDREATVFTPSR